MNLVATLIFQAAAMTGSIQGITCDVATCKPISGVRVIVELPNSGGLTRTATTDTTGAFVLSQLPPGRYELHAEASGFNPAAMPPYITLPAGGRVEDVHVLMYALSSISGRALDSKGQPIQNAEVDAMAFRGRLDGRSTLVTVSSATSDQRGEFHLADLGQGDYFVRLTPPRQNNSGGAFPATFYPNATNPDYAARIRVTGGSEVSGIDISLPSRGVSVSGRFVTEDAQPVRAKVSLVPQMTATLIPPIYATDQMAEQFAIRGVPPGSYYLYAITDEGTQSGLPVNRVPPQWTRLPVVVGDSDIQDLAVRIVKTGSLTGRIVFAPDAIGNENLDLSSIVLQVVPAEMTPSFSVAAKVSKAGEFRFDHLPEMSLFIAGTGVSDNWFISKLLLEGSDVTGTGFSSLPSQNLLLEVVVSNASGKVKGRIIDAQNNPVAAGRVVLLPDISRRMNPAFLRIALANDDGSYDLETLAPGEYTAIAFPPDDLLMSMFLSDSTWVEQCERFGQRVNIAASQSTVVDLVVVTPH